MDKKLQRGAKSIRLLFNCLKPVQHVEHTRAVLKKITSHLCVEKCILLYERPTL